MTAEESSPRDNLRLPTLGGMQFWSDLRHFHQWRIQQHVWTGTCRLLDGDNRRLARGNYQACDEVLQRTCEQQNVQPMSGEAVVVLHGLVRTRRSMQRMCRYLREEGGYDHVFNVSYPSTRLSIADHAAHLAMLLERLAGIEKYHFVAHSLGNIVIRHYLANHADPRVGRMVMLGAPNNGSRLAQRLAIIPPISTVLGITGQQMGRLWTQLQPQLATPECEFGILSGGNRSGRGYNPLLPGDDDLIVTVEETRLVGAHDFSVLPVQHTFMMNDLRARQQTLAFLRHGFFIDSAQRHPIE